MPLSCPGRAALSAHGPTFAEQFRLMNGSSFQIEVSTDLLARAASGDVAAFEEIYRRFERPAYTLAWRMLGDSDGARDTLHDAMLKVFQRIGQYRHEAPFWAWLRQIVCNEALMRLRRREPPAADIDADDIIDIAAPPWVVADARSLERALAKLPALTRSVLWLYHVEGYSHPEIAALVGKTTSFSKSQLARGTARLRALLDPQPESGPCLIHNAQIG
jgi:RNA polymerase sigma-70 factor (ECF subfamily)